MIAEQSSRTVFLLDADKPAAEIEITVRMEIPQSSPVAGGDVSTWLRYEPEVPEQLQDELHRALYNGVHAGLATIDAPLPQGGIAVEVSRLVVKTPELDTLSAASAIGQVAGNLHTLVTYTVASLWQGLSTWSDTSTDQRFIDAPHG
jgi:hypothetical protein